jgi:hypothetical protein
MRGTLKTAIVVVAAMLAIAAAAFAEEGPTRQEYVAKVDPICKENADANQKILKGVKDKARQGKLKAAGQQFIQAAAAFGGARQKIVAVPVPPEYAAKLQKWFVYLKRIQTTLSEIGKYLKQGNKVKATHLTIQLEHSVNSANNISYVLEFHYCHLNQSQFF